MSLTNLVKHFISKRRGPPSHTFFAPKYCNLYTLSFLLSVRYFNLRLRCAFHGAEDRMLSQGRYVGNAAIASSEYGTVPKSIG